MPLNYVLDGGTGGLSVSLDSFVKALRHLLYTSCILFFGLFLQPFFFTEFLFVHKKNVCWLLLVMLDDSNTVLLKTYKLMLFPCIRMKNTD